MDNKNNGTFDIIANLKIIFNKGLKAGIYDFDDINKLVECTKQIEYIQNTEYNTENVEYDTHTQNNYDIYHNYEAKPNEI